MCETWLRSQNNNVTALLKEYGYKICHFNRITKKGGGVAIISKSNYKPKFEKSLNYISFECIIETLKTSSNTVNLTSIVLYRNGSESFQLFLDEFYKFLEYVKITFKHFVICGDFNVHVNKENHPDTVKFNDILHTFSVNQFVQSSTQKCGNTLDLIITDPDSVILNDIIVDSIDTLNSDHFPIYFKLLCNIESSVKQEISYRNFKNINMPVFHADISNDTDKYLTEADASDFKSCVDLFNNVYGSTVDIHAPVINKVVNTVSRPPWMDSEFVTARRERRILYKRWKRKKTPENRNAFELSRAAVNVLATNKRRAFYQESIKSSENSQKELFKMCNTLLDTNKKSQLPYSEDYNSLANKFNNYFVEKIEKIRDNLDSPVIDVHNLVDNNISTLDSFKPVTAEDILKQVNSSKIKTSQSDPIPAFILRSSVKLMIPSIVHLVNSSMGNGSMEGLKESIVTPILKKPGLDHEVLSNYRPVCGGFYIDKLIQKNVLSQLNDHMDLNGLHIPLQSGYKSHHSCETVLLGIVNKILLNLDNNYCSVLLLLDCSAAFDTVDHEQLLLTLIDEIGLRGIALNWFKSFLHNRTQATSVKGCTSTFINMKYGVPQGSVLGPVLFNIYVRNFIKLLTDAGFLVHGYADDHQVVFAFRIQFQYHALCHLLPKCLDLISQFMSSHFLKLNASKSNLLIFSPQNLRDQVYIDKVYLGSNLFIPVSFEALNLGVKLDYQLTFSPQISMLLAQSYKLLSNIGTIRKYLTVSDVRCLVNAIIVSRLDNCNSLLYGIPEYEINRLQKLQNSCARLIYSRKKFDHVGDLFKELHWLPVKQRIIFKILMFVFKIFLEMAPLYLKDCITICNLDNRVLYVPKTRTVYGDRAFSNCAPRLWNALPDNLRNCDTLQYFKSHVKHHLFSNFHEYISRVNRYKT